MVENLRLLSQHFSFFLLIYGGRFGIRLGSSLPCFACPYVHGCAGHCYLMVLQRSSVGFQTAFDSLFSSAALNIFWPFVIFLLFFIPLSKLWCSWICPFCLVQDWISWVRKKLCIREIILTRKTRKQMMAECEDQVSGIEARGDYIPELDPFLESLTLSLFPKEFVDKAVTPPVMTLCIQAPLELFLAAGLPVFKLACGSYATQNLAPLQLPALTCPMIKSLAGLLDPHLGLDPTQQRFVIPTTCDWVVKFSELTGIYGTADIHFMELPHLRENERSSRRWLEEIQALKAWLEKTAQKKITPKALYTAIKCHASAFELFSRLIDLKRAQQMPALHFALIANALPYQDINQWITHAAAYVKGLNPLENTRAPILLTGSPIVFPNYKLLHLIENAGMAIAADDICSLERTFPGAVTFEDKSEYGLLRALAERNHKACICPTFADNQRRINGILNILEKEKIKGIIFHVLKGCHPYDMESGMLEIQLKEKGYRFLKIETDYVKEDEQNIVTRLEAFRRTLDPIQQFRSNK